MRTCIISGGMIEPDFAFPYLQKQQFDIILAADRGLEFCYHYQIMPTYILGDFDSLSPEILNYYKENHEGQYGHGHRISAGDCSGKQ